MYKPAEGGGVLLPGTDGEKPKKRLGRPPGSGRGRPPGSEPKKPRKPRQPRPPGSKPLGRPPGSGRGRAKTPGTGRPPGRPPGSGVGSDGSPGRSPGRPKKPPGDETTPKSPRRKRKKREPQDDDEDAEGYDPPFKPSTPFKKLNSEDGESPIKRLRLRKRNRSRSSMEDEDAVPIELSASSREHSADSFTDQARVVIRPSDSINNNDTNSMSKPPLLTRTIADTNTKPKKKKKERSTVFEPPNYMDIDSDDDIISIEASLKMKPVVNSKKSWPDQVNLKSTLTETSPLKLRLTPLDKVALDTDKTITCNNYTAEIARKTLGVKLENVMLKDHKSIKTSSLEKDLKYFKEKRMEKDRQKEEEEEESSSMSEAETSSREDNNHTDNVDNSSTKGEIEKTEDKKNSNVREDVDGKIRVTHLDEDFDPDSSADKPNEDTPKDNDQIKSVNHQDKLHLNNKECDTIKDRSAMDNVESVVKAKASPDPKTLCHSKEKSLKEAHPEKDSSESAPSSPKSEKVKCSEGEDLSEKCRVPKKETKLSKDELVAPENGASPRSKRSYNTPKLTRSSPRNKRRRLSPNSISNESESTDSEW